MEKRIEKPNLTLQNEGENGFLIIRGGKTAGRVKLTENAFHSAHCNVLLPNGAAELSAGDAPELFRLISEYAGKSLKMMFSSDDAELAAFAAAGGFRRARRCFEAEVTRDELNNKADPGLPSISMCTEGCAEFGECCGLVYRHYGSTHEAVSPLTADEASFFAALPKKAFYYEAGGRITNVALIEGNEIAYIAAEGEGFESAEQFARSVCERLFSEFEKIIFECDDCDPAAMALFGLFDLPEEPSWDTWIC